ncbi:hypothetical protein [Legionella bononiensis]|uniref:Uncharacterized protein n=1 Tax=Legionella bononiensis TaxID=2793102 RepID=A0ABS1WE52_9GAMM|nr:hypothetical protein [Legionella bononiensis]MBL7479575.1 hypothetical protein [Legionella bononiensis]MBL7527550.1 hypothetical protein [Legionella bononiensis]
MKELYKDMEIYCFAVKFPDGFQPSYKITLNVGINMEINRECPERFTKENEALEFAMKRAKCKIDAGLSEDVW